MRVDTLPPNRPEISCGTDGNSAAENECSMFARTESKQKNRMPRTRHTPPQKQKQNTKKQRTVTHQNEFSVLLQDKRHRLRRQRQGSRSKNPYRGRDLRRWQPLLCCLHLLSESVPTQKCVECMATFRTAHHWTMGDVLHHRTQTIHRRYHQHNGESSRARSRCN